MRALELKRLQTVAEGLSAVTTPLWMVTLVLMTCSFSLNRRTLTRLVGFCRDGTGGLVGGWAQAAAGGTGWGGGGPT